MPPGLVTDPDRIARALEESAPLPPRERILLADPRHYDVTREDNPHTVDEHGRLHPVDDDEARRQWEMLRSSFETHGFRTEVLGAREGLPDLVFCCNTAWPFLDEEGSKRYVPARMRYEGRRGEVPVMEDRLRKLGYRPAALPERAGTFEAGGDLQWLGDRRVLVGGTGPRTDRDALEAVARVVAAPVVALNLTEEAFYHLDTCLAVLSRDEVAFVPGAFDAASRDRLAALGASLVEIPEEEALDGFAANLHCPDGETVFIDEANPRTIGILEDRGYDVVGVDTSQFRKAGGSVFCMTNQAW